MPVRVRVTGLAAAIALVIAAACGSPTSSPSPAVSDSRDTAAPAPSAPPSASSSARPKIVMLGDSLTAGLGLPAEDAYPSVVARRLEHDGLAYDVVNAGVSGDTSAGGLSRVDWALDGNVAVLVVALGGNDALRGLPVEQLKANLADIIRRAQARGIRVVLAGMEAPPNYGREYIVSFHKVYPALAAEYRVPLVPFLLQHVDGVASLNQPDGIHPTAAGARIVADNVLAVLEPLLRSATTSAQ
jgi:acyl-CoA thioesterase-1